MSNKQQSEIANILYWFVIGFIIFMLIVHVGARVIDYCIK